MTSIYLFVDSFFFKQKTAYEMRISDWSSDVCSSDLEFGPIGILVNNAGITRDNLLLRMKDEEWNDILDTNLTSVFRTCKAVMRGKIGRASCRERVCQYV